MIETKEANRSLLIPKWLSFKKSYGREFASLRKGDRQLDSKTEASFKEDYKNFKINPDLTKACDLLHCSVVLNNADIAKEAAEFLAKQNNLTGSTRSLVTMILGNSNNDTNALSIEEKISHVRTTLKKQTRNPLLWIELGRLHTIKGQTEKAERCIVTAVALAPVNRFIVRAAARFFIHMDAPDAAYFISNRAYESTRDPWLHATLINCAILAGKKLPKPIGIELTNIPPDSLFHYSELIASIAVSQLRFGSERRAKKLFRLAWSSPSEAVIAHAEWVIRTHFPTLVQEIKIDFSQSAEASSWHNYFNLDLTSALEYAREWSLEEPYSTHPFASGSCFACIGSKYALGAGIAKEGLIANPDDLSLKNNLAYALLKQNDIEGAHGVLAPTLKYITEAENVFLLATSGLLFYKTGNINIGRELYLKSCEISRRKGNRTVAALALLHMAEAEKEANSDKADEFLQKAIDESAGMDEPSIIILRDSLVRKEKILLAPRDVVD